MTFDNEYIASRIKRSQESVEEAKLLFENEHYLTSVNRLYYAVFYFACGCLASKQILSKTHSGIKAKFHENLVKPQHISYNFGKLYDRLFRERHDADYGDFEVLSKEEVAELLAETELQLTEVWQNFKKTF